jgi:PAS domain S-box-containing protein
MAMAIDNAMLRETERQRRMQLEAILSELTGAVSAFDESGFLTLSNAAERDLFDLTTEEARLGQSMQDYLRAKYREQLDDAGVDIEDNPAIRALQGERTQDLEQVVVRKDGERRFISTNSRPIVVDGQITGAVSISRDVTGQHVSDRREKMRLAQLERAAQRAKALSDLVVDINAEKDAQSVSETALHRILREVRADSGVILLCDESGRFHASTVYGEQGYQFPEEGLDLADAPRTANAFSQYRPIVVPANSIVGQEADAAQVGEKGSVLIIPMQIRGQRIGVAYLGFRNDPALDESDLTFCSIWGRQCAQAIDKVMLVDQLEFAHGRLMAIIDQLVQAVIILDAPDGEIVISNRAAEALWGRSLDDDHVRAETLPIIDEEGYPLDGDEHPLVRPLRTQEHTVGEPLTVVRSDGAHVDVLASHSPLFDGRGSIIGSVSVLQDREDFKPLDRSKDEFISVVAHELRNPLTSLRGNLQLLQRRFRKRDDDTVVQDVERIDSIITQVDRIADLVSRMLDVSRVDLGSLDVSVADADAGLLVRSVITEAQGLNSDRPIVLRGPETLPVVWDAARVQQVLGNLMQNAARYAPEGPVEVELCEFDGDRVRITVRDHGPGVPARIKKRLFKQYHRFDDGQDARELAANGNHGLGIGLYISARLARAHGGSLTVENAVDGGAIFTLELPRDASRKT